jgi:DNA repair exonuclease SbcCD ATPase subunit
MKIREFVQQRWWRNLIGYLYSWGASIVMIGALMKLEHFKLSSYFLIAGLGTEAVIFFFSAFEPLPEDWEWDRVYPELADKKAKIGKKFVHPSVGATPTQRFDEMLAKAEISPELFTRLGNGMQKLAESSNKMSEISHAHIETQQFSQSVKKASENLNSFGDAYKHSTEELNRSASTLTQSYTKTAELISKLNTSGSDHTGQLEKMNKNLGALNSVYELQLRGEDAHLKTSKAVHEGLDHIMKNLQASFETTKQYRNEVEKMNKNLGALNSVYELQLKGEDAHLKSAKAAHDGLDLMMNNLQASVQNTKQYRDEVEKLGKKLSALNKVYGNMLTAMNVKENV